MKINNITKEIDSYEKSIEQMICLISGLRRGVVEAFIAERKKRRLSLRDVSKKFGISISYLHDIEKGRRPLTLAMFDKIKDF